LASQIKRMWLHDENDTIKISPYTTVESIKIQPDLNQDEFLEFKEDYNGVKTTITNNKSQADAAINNLDIRVTALENNSSSGSGAGGAIATPASNGLMSKEDKAKLDLIEENANNYTLPIASLNRIGGIKSDGITTFIDNDGTLHAIGGSTGSGIALENLSNVEIDAILDGDILQYDHTKKKWINTLISTVSGEGEINYVAFEDIANLFDTEEDDYEYDLTTTY